MPIASNKSYVGIAKETTRGTAVAPTASIPVTSITAHDEITQLLDTGLRGSMVDFYTATPGQAWSTWGCSGFAYPDSIGFWLASLLPDLTVTGSGPYTTTFAPNNGTTTQPKGYTIADYSGLDATSRLLVQLPQFMLQLVLNHPTTSLVVQYPYLAQCSS